MNLSKYKTHPAVNVLVLFVAFAWLGCAFILGTDSKRLILHPIVPVFIILFLFSLWNDTSLRNIIVITSILIGLWLLIRLQMVFTPFIIGFAFAYVVNVSLAGLQSIPIPLPKGKKFHLPKAAAVAVIILLIIGIISFFAFAIVPQLMKQSAGMQQGIISLYNKIKDYTVEVVNDWEERGNYPLKDQMPESLQTIVENNIQKISVYIQEKIPSVAQRANKIVGNIFSTLSSGLIGTVGQISSIFFILTVFIYAVTGFRSHMRSLSKLIPEKNRENAIRYFTEIDTNMRGFLKGQITVIIAISFLSAIVYSILQVPFPLLVGVLAGLCNVIPTVGPILGGFFAGFSSLLGFVSGNVDATKFLIQLALIVAAVVGIQIIDNSLISPKIMSHAVDVHPLVVLFAVLLAASFVGIWGAILAIPGIVIFKTVIEVSGVLRREKEESEIIHGELK
ncbi:AI-2E family transporter [Candidatus Poribacteria bacterium]|nr:AI-2E family transporter [Candidatus Poribacteria bacterium]